MGLARRGSMGTVIGCALVFSAVACGSSSGGNPAVPDGGGDASVDGAPLDGGGTVGDAPHDVATSDSSPPADASAGPAFCGATWGAVKAAFEGCCPSGDTTTNDYKFVDAIYGYVVQECDTILGAAIGKGRVMLPAAGVQACETSVADTIAKGECWPQIDTNQANPTLLSSSTCTGAVVGLVARGGPCAVDFECQDGLACLGWGGASDGTCVDPPAIGQPCGAAADAGSAFSFDWGLGQHPDCATGATCSSGACVAQHAAGGACTADTDCTAGLTCHLGVCGTTSPAAAGGRCIGKVDCQQGLYCGVSPDAGMVCQAREPGGGACTSTGDQCAGYCTTPDGGTTGVCTAVCGSG